MTAVTVVMPVLNEERSIVGAIDSVLGQTLTDLELLVVDGDSTDATVEWVRAIAEHEPRVRLLRNPARSIPHALNIALGEARGRYIARVDGHASVNETYLERGVAALDADPAVAAVGGRRIGVAQTTSGVAVAAALSSRFGVGDSINHYAETAQDTDHASFGVFRVDVLRTIGGWDENLLVNEDVDLDHRILGRGHRIRFDPGMSIYWHVRESIPALGRQYRRYGRGKAAMVLKNGRGAVRIRHLAPPALVLTLTAAAACAAIGFWPGAVLLGGPYLLALTAATLVTLRSSAPVQAPPHREAGSAVPQPAGDRTGDVGGRRPGPLRLAGSFLAMHLGWGLGFLEGTLLRLRPASSSARLPAAGTASRAEVDITNPQATPGSKPARPGRSSSGV
ncbi:MAG: glycosyltransferase family 2 protein [Kineosporiaceae bacterium]|jgi:GT2 family glycosyltransferase